MTTDGKLCGENLSWWSLGRCGQPARFIVKGRIVMYRCATHAPRYRRPGYIVRTMQHVH